LMNGNPLPIGMNADVNIDILNDVYKETNAVYALNKYELTDKLNLITGLRYEHSTFGGDRISNTNVTASPMKPINTSKTISDERESDNFAAEIGLNYTYSDTGSVFGRYERGFISPMPGQITNKNQNLEYTSNDLKSETSDNFEIGIRDFVGNTYLSWSVFTTYTNDEITLIQGNVHNPATKWWAYENLAKTRRIGTEIFAEHYFDKLTISEGITYIDSKITSGDFKDEKVPLAPEGKLTLKADYKFTSKFNAGLAFNYVGKSTVREFNEDNSTFTTKVSGYHFTDLSLQYKINEFFVVSGGINNIFNDKYNYSETKNTATPAPERNYYIGGTLSF
ncbi:MAG: TonB-dependent receptor, partial [Cetobacterium sp.]